MAAGIRTLVDNARQVSAAQSVIDEVCRSIMDEAAKVHARGRRISPSAMRGLFEKLDEVVMNSLQVVDCRLRETLPTKAKPKCASIDVSYVAVRKKRACEGYHDLYELITLRVVIKPKIVSLHLHPHPIAFQYHAAERLVERVEGQALPFEMIAAELADWSLALWEVFRVSNAPDGMRLSLPCLEGKGMLAGQFATLQVSPIVRETTNKVGRFGNTLGWTDDTHTVFVVKTFVGMETLRPEQIASLNRLARWRMINKAEYMEARDRSLFDVGFMEDGYEVPELAAEKRNELRAILNDMEFKSAMTTKTIRASARRLGRPALSLSSASNPVGSVAERRGWLPGGLQVGPADRTCPSP